MTSKKLKIAFEYNGQKYYEIGRFYMTPVNNCKRHADNNIRIIIVPYWLRTKKNITKFIMKEMNSIDCGFSI